jgi:hypothetical protein
MTDQELRDFIVEEARAIGIDLSAPKTIGKHQSGNA